MDEKLLNLPWRIQLALGGGYLAYLIAYSGLRQHHSAKDTVSRSFAFGLVSSAVMAWAPLTPHASNEEWLNAPDDQARKALIRIAPGLGLALRSSDMSRL